MKIGILTLHEADSYGAVLQAYALQQILDSLGVENEFISFIKKRRDEISNTSGYPAALILRILRAGEQRAALFADFRQKYLRCASPILWQKAADLNAEYDRFIVGSDQVWNPRIPGVDERYFLPFASPEKRYSYAASFGMDQLPKNVQDWCARQLKNFSALSVREENGRKLIIELTGRDAVVCLDPTLLLNRNEWKKMTVPVESEPYVLLFMLKYDSVLVSDAQKEAAGRGLVLRTITAAFMLQYGFEPWSTVGVEYWLSLFRYAVCVFTNSFHGAVFSMVFDRPFHVARMTGELKERNGRIEELLRRVDMEAAFDVLCRPCSSDFIYTRMEKERKISMDFLKRIVTDEIPIYEDCEIEEKRL